MAPEPNGGGKFRLRIQDVLGVLLIFYLIIDKMIVPSIGVKSIAETLAIETRITKLETTSEYVKIMLDKIDKKLDVHIAQK
jgi:hypothetical protein